MGSFREHTGIMRKNQMEMLEIPLKMITEMKTIFDCFINRTSTAEERNSQNGNMSTEITPIGPTQM